MNGRMRTTGRILAALCLLSMEIIAPAPAAGAQPVHVLALHSYAPGYTWTDSMQQTFAETLGREETIELHTEYMDAQHCAHPECYDHREKLYASRYNPETVRLSAIVCSDDAALDFLLERRERLFPGVPIVFCGINGFEPSRLQGRRGITGVNEAISLVETIEFVLQLRPHTQRIAVVGDTTLTGRRNIELLRAAIPRFPNIDFRFLDQLEPEPLRRELKTLSPDDAVLYLSYLRSPSGYKLTLTESSRLIASASPAPVFTCWDFMLGHGFLGGKVVSGRAQALAAAHMAKRILAGIPPDNLPVRMKSPNQYTIDYPVARRFGIAMRNLPADTVVLNRPERPLLQYWRWIAAAILFILLQTTLIVRLLMANASRQRAQAALGESEARWRTYIEKAPIAILLADTTGRYLQVNPAACAMSGYREEEMLRMNLRDLLPPESAGAAEEHFRKVVEKGLSEGEILHRRKDGSLYWAQVLAVRLSENRFLGFCQNVDERKRFEALLEAQRDLAMALSRSSGINETLRACTETAIRLSGMDSGGVYLVNPASGALDLAFHTGLSDSFAAAAAHYEPDSAKARMVTAGQAIYTRFDETNTPPIYRAENLRATAVIPILHEDRAVACLNLASHSLDKVPDFAPAAIEAVIGQMGQSIVRHRAIEALHRSEERLQLALAGADLGTWDWNVKTGEVSYDKGWCRMLGYEVGQVEPNFDGWHGRVHPDDLPRIMEALNRHLEGRTQNYIIEHRLRHRSGEWIWVLSKGRVTERDTEGNPLRACGTHLDITERKHAEDALERAKDEWERTFDAVPDLICLLDADHRILRSNRAFAERIGKTPDETIGGCCYECVHGADFPPAYCPHEMTMRDGLPHSAEVTEGILGGTFMVTTTPLFDSSGNFIGAVHVAHDITERKQAEEERLRLERQILQTQKLESIGVLAGGIAHDFNNLLTAILGHADLAIEQLAATAPARENVEEIKAASRRAADLCRQMLAYSGKGRFVIETINLYDLIEEMIHLLKTSISKRALLRMDLEENLPSIRGDATQIRQIVMNLVINASESLEEKSGAITIVTGATLITPESMRETWLGNEITEGLYDYIEVVDTGCGMDRETQTRLFDPFFTTKFMGRGLGMAAVLGIVRGHKGALQVQSEPGKGSRFRVLLPAMEDEIVRIAHNATTGRKPWRGSGAVLLVDDEETIRAIAGRMLERLGFETLIACDGREALETYVTHRSDIRLVLMDLTMPRMDGAEAFRKLAQINPAIRIVMSSGYSEHELTERFAGPNLRGVLQKPYTLEELCDCMRAALEEE